MNDQQQNAHNVENDAYDANIVPAETAARREREGENYKHTPKSDEHDPDSIDTTAGYTVDSEGLVNNYGIEPEMYYEVPGDAAESQLDADAAAHEQELAEDNDLNDAEVADVV
jgi:hypothetical protein